MSQRVARVCYVCGKAETGQETAGVDGATHRCAACCTPGVPQPVGGSCACDTCGGTFAAEFVQDHGGVLICRGCLTLDPVLTGPAVFPTPIQEGRAGAGAAVGREPFPLSDERPPRGRRRGRIRSGLAASAVAAAATVAAVLAVRGPLHEPDYPAKVQPLLWKMAEVRSKGADEPFVKFVAQYPELYASLEHEFSRTEGALNDQEKARKSWQYARDTMHRFPRARRGPARAMPQYEQAVQAGLTNVDGKLFCAVGYLQRGE